MEFVRYFLAKNVQGLLPYFVAAWEIVLSPADNFVGR